ATELGALDNWSPRLRGLVDALLCNPVPSALVWGPRGILIYNAGYARICGNKHPAALGSSLQDVWPEAWAFNREVIRNGLAGQAQMFNKACFPLLRDGVMQDSWFDLYYGPVPDAQGRIVGLLASVIEITEEVEAQQAYRTQQGELDQLRARLQALSGASFDLTYRMSPNWSQLQQLDGRGLLKDVSGPSSAWMGDYIPPEEQARVQAAIDAAIAGKDMFFCEHRVRRLDGSEGWLQSRAVPMLNAAGEVVEWVGAAIDITARKAQEQGLREADRRKDEFLAMLAHELRNPLSPIGSAAAMLQTGQLAASDVQRLSAVIGRQVTHMTGLIDDLLDVSRVTRGLVSIEREPLSVHDIVQDAVEQVMPLADSRRHRLLIELAPQRMQVAGDRKRLVQVLANLLNNAAKYTPPGGELRVGAALAGSMVQITVQDNGCGMAPELVQRAFDLFAQAERTPDRATGGLGLGLPLVKSLVELHHGSVHCTSAGLGQGSCFTVFLPLLECAAEPPSPMQLAQWPPGAALRILVIDDNLDGADLLAELLQLQGHETCVESESHAALARGLRERPDVFLIDVGLPLMDGHELARRLRADPGTAGALLVAVTGYGQDSDRQRALEAGFDEHLVKPVDVGRLMALLERHQSKLVHNKDAR
ncbi:MAG: ATP-binding protein, partial [Duganella sp.]